MSGQSWSADRYAAAARFVSDLGAPVVKLLDPKPGERILDLGCGDGALTAALAAAGAHVLGVDGSADMVAAARERGLEARVADGARLTFEGEFDAVFSNAALHWMTEADAVIAGVARALRPGGRFVGEFGGRGNVAAVRTALIAVLGRDWGVDTDLSEVWFFPSADDYRARLERAGFAVEEIVAFARPTPAPAGMEAWLETLAASTMAAIPEHDRAEARQRVAALLRPALSNAEGEWLVDYVRLRFKARLAAAR